VVKSFAPILTRLATIPDPRCASRSPRPRCSSPATRRPTSPAISCRWMAAIASAF